MGCAPVWQTSWHKQVRTSLHPCMGRRNGMPAWLQAVSIVPKFAGAALPCPGWPCCPGDQASFACRQGHKVLAPMPAAFGPKCVSMQRERGDKQVCTPLLPCRPAVCSVTTLRQGTWQGASAFTNAGLPLWLPSLGHPAWRASPPGVSRCWVLAPPACCRQSREWW